jgi:superfamily I DNA/RNA helicase
MTFRIADTFTDALAKLANQEQKAVKTTVFDLQLDATGKGLRLHRLTGGRDKHFWSVSVSMDLRIIIHRRGEDVLVCYVDHHDKAYQWAANRHLEVHPNTGAAQLVEVTEVNREVVVPVYVQKRIEEEARPAQATATPPLAGYDGAWLMQYGIPEVWIDRLKAASEDELFLLVEHLPAEAAEAVIDIAAGQIPPLPAPVPADPFTHPDALRRFRLIESTEELEAALEAPWDKWTIFLHPSQRELVAKSFSGPARVSGSAGTGKTVVALHRAAHLARTHEDARVLLATFSDALARALQYKLNRLLQHEPWLAERIDVRSLDGLLLRLLKGRPSGLQLATKADWEEALLMAAETEAHDFTLGFLLSEWQNVVDAWQLETLEGYQQVQRIGRRTRLSQARREKAWAIFAKTQAELARQGLVTSAGLYHRMALALQQEGHSFPYDFVVIDEAQDISVPQLRFLASQVGSKPDGLFFAGDLGQRIFQAPFSWSSLGVEVRGRASTLRINYRTSHQIRAQADLLLSPEIVDLDGNREDRRHTLSVFNGPLPTIRAFEHEDLESSAVAEWIRARRQEGVAPGEMAVFVRSEGQLARGYAAIEAAGQQACKLDEKIALRSDAVTLSTMHLAKGLEFKAVAVIACDEDVIPDPSRLELVSDMAEIEEVYETERHLLYVACTRAREHLWISSAGVASEFLGDMGRG